MMSACFRVRWALKLVRDEHVLKRKAGCGRSHCRNHTVAAAEALAPVLNRQWLLKAPESQVRTDAEAQLRNRDILLC